MQHRIHPLATYAALHFALEPRLTPAGSITSSDWQTAALQHLGVGNAVNYPVINEVRRLAVARPLVEKENFRRTFATFAKTHRQPIEPP